MFERRDVSRERREGFDDFRSLNLNLVQGQGSHLCRSLWDLLTPRHREDPDCCHRGTRIAELDDCFLANRQPWKDINTDIPVVVAHPSCGHTERDNHHDHFRGFFEVGGQVCQVSSTGWYDGRASLVVIARADVAESIRLLTDDSFEPVVQLEWPPPDCEKMEAVKLAEERVDRDRSVRLALGEEFRGNYMTALRLFCDIGYRDRTGGFTNRLGSSWTMRGGCWPANLAWT